jgi:protein-disulfide isomerase
MNRALSSHWATPPTVTRCKDSIISDEVELTRWILKGTSSATLACLLMLIPCQPGQAQQQTDKTDRKDVQLLEDIAILKNDIKALEGNQKLIISQLNELKQLLREKPSPIPTLQVPPSMGIQGEPFRGDGAAGVAIIEYADFECPFCGKYEREVYPQIFDNYVKTGKVRLFYRDLPIPIHPHAMLAARSARCAGEQGKYWEMHDSLFAKQTGFTEKGLSERAAGLGIEVTKFSECLSSDRFTDAIRERIAEAQKMGIDGTPTFFLGTIAPNGDLVNIDRSIVGAEPYKDFKSNLDELLASAAKRPGGGR